jgi:hypothetical protein
MILGLGCGGLALLTVILGAAGFFFARSATPPPMPTYGGAVTASPVAPTPPQPAAGDLKGELRDLTPIKAKYGKSIRFVGEFFNTGSGDLGYPSAKVTFYDAAGTAVDSGTCGTLMRVLPAGEKVPCSFSIFKGLDWKTYKIDVTPHRPLSAGQIAQIEITEDKFTPKRGYQPDTVEGKLTNKSTFKAKNVWAMVTLYDANKKIVGADNALVAGSDLEAGASGLFSAKAYEVAGPPASYRVIAIGYSE